VFLLFQIRKFSACDRSHESGVSIIEFAIILPVLFILLVSVLDLSQALINYLSLTQVVREGVRTGTARPDILSDSATYGSRISTTDTDYNTWRSECLNASPFTQPAAPCGHITVHERIFRLIGINSDLYNLFDYTSNASNRADEIINKFSISSSYSAATPGKETFEVNLVTSYSGFFIDGWKMRVNQLGPYLNKPPD
jgi:hypothetical protein